MTDGRSARYTDWSTGYDPAAWLDRTIMATRSEVFALHGLDPMP
jgi:acetoin utilization protein AcuC